MCRSAIGRRVPALPVVGYVGSCPAVPRRRVPRPGRLIESHTGPGGGAGGGPNQRLWAGRSEWAVPPPGEPRAASDAPALRRRLGHPCPPSATRPRPAARPADTSDRCLRGRQFIVGPRLDRAGANAVARCLPREADRNGQADREIQTAGDTVLRRDRTAADS